MMYQLLHPSPGPSKKRKPRTPLVLRLASGPSCPIPSDPTIIHVEGKRTFYLLSGFQLLQTVLINPSFLSRMGGVRRWGGGESLSLTRQGGGKINTKKNVPLVSFISLLGCYADLKNNVQVTTSIGKGYYHLEWIKKGKFIYIIFLFIKSCINGTFQFMIINHSSSKYLTFVWYTWFAEFFHEHFEPPKCSSIMWQI